MLTTYLFLLEPQRLSLFSIKENHSFTHASTLSPRTLNFSHFYYLSKLLFLHCSLQIITMFTLLNSQFLTITRSTHGSWFQIFQLLLTNSQVPMISKKFTLFFSHLTNGPGIIIGSPDTVRKREMGISLVVQRLRLCAFTARGASSALVGELRSHKLPGADRTERKMKSHSWNPHARWEDWHQTSQ